MREPVIVSAVRTAVGSEMKALNGVTPGDLGALVIREAIKRAGVAPGEIDDVIFGNVLGGGGNTARLALLLAGLPVEVPGMTVDRQCSSSLQCVALAANAIRAGDGEVFVVGGTESMTRRVWLMENNTIGGFSRVPPAFTRAQLAPADIDPSMGITAENVAEQFKISREDQDAFALESQRRAIAAMDGGKFKDEIVPVVIPQKKADPVVFEVDEHPRRDTSPEKLAKLPPVFKAHGTVTAGNSSGIGDGASACVVMEAKRAERVGQRPLARVVATTAAGVHPTIMGIGPVPAVQKVLRKAGLSLDQIDLIELNEAFASQSLVVIRELGLDRARVNVNGGAIALAHPIAATGTKLVATLLYEMRRRQARYGLVTMCVGGGQGLATIF
ncbi:MAG: thiolase family protein, partial [Candidatus Rokubacteria bacterium]|nr:thiolase family protein [Candidatus Rokubacteria bacterium]